MPTPTQSQAVALPDARDFAVGVGRAFAGALLFGLPMLMTMEMWALGHSMPPGRLALLLAVTLPLLVRLSRFGGFRRTASLADDIADALVAIAVAAVAASSVLALLGVLTGGQSAREVAGMVAIQLVPGSIGAMLAQNQLGAHGEDEPVDLEDASFGGEIFLMVVGALFLSLNLAPTDEVMEIAIALPSWQQILMLAASLTVMHALVYSLDFGGTEATRPGEGFWSVFLRYTVTGYVAVLITSAFVLWCFGRFDGLSLPVAASAVVVLALPGAIGASVARLVL